MVSKDPGKSRLKRLYNNEKMTLVEIGEEFDVHENTVRRWFDKHDIERRVGRRSKDPGKDELERLYHGENMTLQEIGEQFSTSHSSVIRWFDKHNIERRPAKVRSKDPGKDELERLYHGENMTFAEIGDKLDVHENTVWKWVDEHGIETRNGKRSKDPGKDELERLYHGENMTFAEIGDKLDVSEQTVWRWAKKHDIETRTGRREGVIIGGETPANFALSTKGYEVWRDYTGDNRERVKVHRLLAVVEFGFDKVAGNHVHHTTNIPWDNRPDAIEVHPPTVHNRMSARGGGDPHPKYSDKAWLEHMYVTLDKSCPEMAEIADCSVSTIYRHLKKYNIDTSR